MLNCILTEKFVNGIDYEQQYEKSYLVSVIETIFRFSKDIYIITDCNLRVKSTNSRFIDHSTDISKLLRINIKNMGTNSGEVKKSIKFGQKTIKADVTISKIFTDSKKPDGYLLIIRDKTKSEMSNTCLERVRNFLKHELKTAIFAQSIGVRLLKSVKNNGEILDELENSTENIFRMLKNTICEIDINENPIIPQKQKINIKTFLETIKNDGKNFLKSRNNTLCLEYKNNFDFLADENLLKQVITTVLYHSNNGASNTQLYLSGEQHKSEVVIKISGCFNAPKRKFFKELNSSVNIHDRFGFDNGLYLSSKIIEAHNGKIKTNTKDFISTVSVILPV